jgi:hypothetical protein
MGKLYTAILPDGSECFAADFGMGRATLFFDIALLLERYVNMPCGIAPDAGDGEHKVIAAQFIPFFEQVWNEGWIAESKSGFLSGWAAHAAGIVENITLQPRQWVDRNGATLTIQRYTRPDENPEGHT